MGRFEARKRLGGNAQGLADALSRERSDQRGAVAEVRDLDEEHRDVEAAPISSEGDLLGGEAGTERDRGLESLILGLTKRDTHPWLGNGLDRQLHPGVDATRVGVIIVGNGSLVLHPPHRIPICRSSFLLNRRPL